MKRIFAEMETLFLIVTYIGIPLVAVMLLDGGHPIAFVSLTFMYVRYMYTHRNFSEQTHEFKRTKQHLFTIEKKDYQEGKKLEIALQLLTQEQRNRYYELTDENNLNDHTPYEYQYFSPYTEDGKNDWQKYDF
jgi:hypothetical protein